ncbi:MAG: sarcosine oxidase subunit gamma family protein [Pseudomonadota bacterium]
MSDPVSALGNASDESGLVSIHELGPVGMITLRGDLSDKGLMKAVKAVAGVDVPGQRAAAFEGDSGAVWMSPDELLVLCAYADVPSKLAGLQERLSGMHALAVNVSDARAVFELRGAAVRDVLAKVAPVDLSPEAMPPGMPRRTRFAQVPAAFWLVAEGHARVICFRSVTQYMLDLLRTVSRPGSEVDHF